MKKVYLALLITFTIWGSRLFNIKIPLVGDITPIIALTVISVLYLIFIITKTKKIYFDKIQKKTAIFLIIVIICAILATFLHTVNIYGWTTYIVSFAILICCMNFIANRDEIEFCEKVLLVNVFIVLLLGLYECFTGNYIIETYESYRYQRSIFGLYKPVATFYNINNLGIFILLMTPICYNALDNIKKGKYIIKYIFVILVLFIIISTNSRGAIIGFVIFLTLYYKEKMKQYKIMYNLILISCIMLLIISVFISGLFMNNEESSISEESRIEIWKQTIKTIIDNNFVGVGPGNISAYNLKADYYSFSFGNPHNYFLEFLGDFGIVGFISFIVWLYYIMKTYKKKIKTEKDKKIKHRAENYYIYYIIFIISTITPSTMMTAQYIWLGFGLSIAFLSIYRKEGNNICQEQKNLYEI